MHQLCVHLSFVEDVQGSAFYVDVAWALIPLPNTGRNTVAVVRSRHELILADIDAGCVLLHL